MRELTSTVPGARRLLSRWKGQVTGEPLADGVFEASIGQSSLDVGRLPTKAIIGASSAVIAGCLARSAGQATPRLDTRNGPLPKERAICVRLTGRYGAIWSAGGAAIDTPLS